MYHIIKYNIYIYIYTYYIGILYAYLVISIQRFFEAKQPSLDPLRHPCAVVPLVALAIERHRPGLHPKDTIRPQKKDR